MDDWTQQLTGWLDAVGAQAEAVGAELAEQVEQTLWPWIEPLWQPLMDTPLEIPVDLDQAIEAIIQPWHQTIVPPLNNHPVCSGCQHYHGEVYGNEMLVCGMYPYGPMADQTSCADKQAIDWQEPWKTWFQSGPPKP